MKVDDVLRLLQGDGRFRQSAVRQHVAPDVRGDATLFRWPLARPAPTE